MTRFRDPVEYRRPQDETFPLIGRFSGLPVGVQVTSDIPLSVVSGTDPASKPTTTAGTAAANGWTLTRVGTGNISGVDSIGNVSMPHMWFSNTTAASGDSNEVQRNDTTLVGTGYVVATTTTVAPPTYFEATVVVDAAALAQTSVGTCNWFVGFASTDTTLISGGTGGAASYVGFLHREEAADSTGRIYFVSGRAASATGNLVDGILRPTGWTTVGSTAGGTAASTKSDLDNRRMSVGGPLKMAFLLEPGTAGADKYYLWMNDQIVPGSPFASGTSGIGRFPVAAVFPSVAHRTVQAFASSMGFRLVFGQAVRSPNTNTFDGF